MRLDELVLRIPGDEFRVHFHPQLTVLAGIGMLERQALSDSFVAAMSGTAENAVLTYVDTTGRTVELVAAGGTTTARYLDDGSPARSLVGSIAADTEALRALVLVHAGDLGLSSSRGRSDENPELGEARKTLEEVTEALQAAMGGRHQVDGLETELETVEQQLRAAEDSTARREYAKVLADLERARAEAAALQGGGTGAEADGQLLGAAADARDLASRWRSAARRVADGQSRCSRVDRLEPEALAAARRIPEDMPADLRRLLAHLESTRRERDALDAKLREQAASTLPTPSDDRVVDLATADQSVLWATRDRVLHAMQNVEREQLAMGGTGSSHQPGGQRQVDQLEEAHSVVEDAERLVADRRPRVLAGAGALGVLGVFAAAAIAPVLGLVLVVVAGAAAFAGLNGPGRQLAAARKAEKTMLETIGAPSYMAFHLRRVDAAIGTDAHTRLEATAREHKAALQAWAAIAPRTSVEQAVALEAEARAYARSLAELGDKAGELEALRRDLTDKAEPVYEQARQALAEVLMAYRVEESAVVAPEDVERTLRQQVALGRDARAQDALEEAEAIEEKLGGRLNDLLHQLGFRDGTVEARVGALEWAIDRAIEREQARERARTRAEIEADLERLQEEVRRLRRPEWATVQAAEAKLPDADELRARRDELTAALDAAAQGVVDLERLADRHSAMERRVAALEAKHDGGKAEAALTAVAEVQDYLLAHLTRASHVGPMDEPVPVLLDEPFLRIPAERKWELLDMLRRVGEQTQIIYLTDDPFVGAWARRRASTGSITLLEPVDA